MKSLMKIISVLMIVLCIGCFSVTAAEENQDNSSPVIEKDGTEYYRPYKEDGKQAPYYIFIRRNVTGLPFADTLYVKSEINGFPVKVIKMCSGVKKLILGDNIERIEDMVFAEDDWIEEVILSDSVTYVGPSAFWLSYLKKVTFGNGMKVIKTKGFSDCRYLEEVLIKEGVTSIENGVFSGDSKIKSITLPASITNIGRHAFNLNLSNPTVYGYSGSYAERWAKAMGYTFKAIGTAPVITDSTPTLGITGIRGNTVEVYANAPNDEWEEYEYNISSIYKSYDEDYDITYTPEKLAFRYWGDRNESVKFPYIPAGKYYITCRGSKDTEDEKVYSNWSIPRIITIAESSPSAPQYVRSKVTKNKNGTYDVTVTLNIKNGLKYDAVLTGSYEKTELYDIREYNERNWRTIYDMIPYEYDRIVKKNQKTQTITFKNVKKGTYYFGAHSYNRGSDGKKNFSKWSKPGKIKVG